jgi:hypothetical protein
MGEQATAVDHTRKRDNIRTGIFLALLSASCLVGFFVKVYFFK